MRTPPHPRYRWKPGQSGNPAGRPRAKPLTDLVREALAEVQGKKGKTAARAVVESWIAEAAAGSVHHLRELLERLEGRPADAPPPADPTDRPRRIVIPETDARLTTRED